MAERAKVEDDLSPIKRALLEQRRMKSRLEALERERHEPIALIGLGCRFPGAEDPEAFWRLLIDGVDAIREVPADRWDINGLYDPNPDAPGRVATRWGGFLDRVDLFDPQFFGISPREAESMDPQQRLTLEVAWEALEHAAQSFDSLAGSATGVFLGLGTADYLQLHTERHDKQGIDAYLATGNSHSVAAGRLSYVLGLRGPSMAVDTACSSSLVAVHLACQSLRAGDCRMALAGGVNTLLWVDNTISLSKAHMMAPDGRCKTFDAAADGFVRAEGCGMVVLKRLSDAQADGDRIVALILGNACNQDGRSSGLTAPNGPAQEAVIRQALERAGLQPADVGYVETHGTGTSLGDPVEVQALGNVLGKGRAAGDPLFIGSVKTNIGHLEAAAGVAGLIKAALCVERGEIPPHLHFQTPNPHIAWGDYALSIPTAAMAWTGGKPRVAGVSAFGLGGTNVHLLVGQAPEGGERQAEVERPAHLLVVSAKDEKALYELAARHSEHLSQHPDTNPADFCFTLNTGRAHWNERAALIGRSGAELQLGLSGLSAGELGDGVMRGQFGGSSAPELAFLFTGQGSQYVGMGRELYGTQPTFRKALDECAELLAGELPAPLLEVMFSEQAGDERLHQTRYTQPVLFALEYALYEMWRSWGVEPAAVLGHSIGEYVAACVAGVFSLEDGLKLVAARGRLMQALPSGGAMAAVLASECEVAAVLGGEISLAALNGPANTVISGRERAVEAAVAVLEKRGVKGSRLVVSHAFHSALMEPMLAEFEAIAGQVEYRRPQKALVSNVTGRLVEGEEVSQARYWRRQVREAVRFGDGIQALVKSGYRSFVEVGPQPVLIGMGKQCAPDADLSWVATLRRGRGEWEELLRSVGELYVQGAEIDWRGFDRDYSRCKLRLPSYPFQRERYWIADKTTVQTDTWTPMIERASQQSVQAPIDLDLNGFAGRWSALERLTEARIIDTLRTFGLFGRAGERHAVKGVLQAAGIGASYGQLLTRWMERLAVMQLLDRDGGEYVARRPLPEPELAAAINEVFKALADLPPLLRYIERCGGALPAVLRGQSSPLDTLFPAGSFELAEFLYETWALPRYFNGIVRSALESIAQGAGRDGRPLRILEIGAGTGGTSAAALAALAGAGAGQNVEYWFTDLSELFLARAARKFSQYPFVEYRVFDLDRDPAAQGVPEHGFDVVLAANVLHATRDLGAAVERVKSLLASGGVLLAYEVTEHLAWFDMSVALIEGWQKHGDAIRDRHPLLRPEEWAALLGRHGFEAVEAFPRTGSPAEILGHHVLMARAPRLQAARPAATVSCADAAATRRAGSAPVGALEEAAAFVARMTALMPGDRTEALVDFVRGHVAGVLGLGQSKTPGRAQRLMDLGVDSLMAVELAGRLTAGLGQERPLPSTLIFDYPTIQAIAGYLEGLLFKDSSQGTARDEPGRPVAGLSEKLADLSEEEAEMLLLAKLQQIDEGSGHHAGV